MAADEEDEALRRTRSYAHSPRVLLSSTQLIADAHHLPAAQASASACRQGPPATPPGKFARTARRATSAR
ncbi:hypothetical protein UK15_06575 [Streptomyces variegatus]|uniref:Uncharacterized protein n=1 Tax=Streptomyces variegatus TaxID=284040 RepID=A0A0M2GYS9_9ACTN|nr:MULTISPECIES: hypothetical protein [Streptomyces]KJK40695.1 hypothetical protein UK15_06575 [Streptomyces variegatus]